MAISASEEPLGRVFTSDYRLSIPSFQRAYSWRPGNVLQLLDDIRSASQTPNTPYFLGSLILVHDKGNAYEVLDGQQRLVSLTIIIAAMRELEVRPPAPAPAPAAAPAAAADDVAEPADAPAADPATPRRRKGAAP